MLAHIRCSVSANIVSFICKHLGIFPCSSGPELSFGGLAQSQDTGAFGGLGGPGGSGGVFGGIGSPGAFGGNM